MGQDHSQLVRGLRAAADPSRLRLLRLLSLGEFAVTELTGILGQSQPRMSRHLRLMTEAGLLERFRELHWVYYRLAAEGEGAQLARMILDRLDRSDPVIALDRERAAAVLAGRAAAAGDGAGVARAPADGDADLARLVVAELGANGCDALLYVGRAPAQMLQVLGPFARRVLGVSDSRLEVQRARASLHGGGLAHCVLQQGDLQTATSAGASYDAVILDRPSGGDPWSAQDIGSAARMLRPGGRLALVEDYEALAGRAPGGNPLGLLRDRLELGGLRCVRLRPVDMGASHLLVAVAALEPGAASH